MKRTMLHYRKNPASYKKAQAKNKLFNAKPEQKAKRAELGRIRYRAKKNGQNIKGKHYDHAVGKFVDAYTNQSRNEKSRMKGYRRR